MFEVVISGVLGSLIGVLGAYFMVKKATNTDRLAEISQELLSELLKNEESQKNLYGLGVLVGNGVKTGIGLAPKGGKMKLQDLIMMGAAQWIQGGGLANFFQQGTTIVPRKPDGQPKRLGIGEIG